MGMFIWVINFIGRNLLLSVNLLFVCGSLAAVASAERDFEFVKLDSLEKYWLKNPNYQQEIFNNRKIYVSAIYKENNIKESKNQKQWQFKGVGAVKTDLDLTWKKALNFAELKKASKFLHDVDYDPQNRILKLQIVILQKSIFLKLKLHFDEKSKAQQRTVDAEVMDGPLKNAVGRVVFLDSLSQGTKIEALGVFENEVPFGEVVFKLAIESLMKYVAEVMRTHIEQR
jgi:hypothetical protein